MLRKQPNVKNLHNYLVLFVITLIRLTNSCSNTKAHKAEKTKKQQKYVIVYIDIYIYIIISKMYFYGINTLREEKKKNQ